MRHRFDWRDASALALKTTLRPCPSIHPTAFIRPRFLTSQSTLLTRLIRNKPRVIRHRPHMLRFVFLPRRIQSTASEFRLESRQAFFEVSVVPIRRPNDPSFIDNAPMINRRALFFPLCRLLSLLSRLPPSIRLIPAQLVNGVEVPENQPVAAPKMALDLLAGLLVRFTRASLSIPLDHVRLFLKFDFEHPQPVDGLVNHPEQHHPRSHPVRRRDPDLRPPLELFLVTGKLVVVHFAPKFLKCVLKLRLEDVAREEHACDPGAPTAFIGCRPINRTILSFSCDCKPNPSVRMSRRSLQLLSSQRHPATDAFSRRTRIAG